MCSQRRERAPPPIGCHRGKVVVVAQRQRGFVRTVPEPDHQLGRRERDLTRLVRRQGARPALGIENADVHVGQRHADRPELVRAADRVHAKRHHRLGQRIALDNAAAGQRFEALLRLGQQGRSAGEADLDRLEVDLAPLHVGMIEQRVVQRRNAVEECRLHSANRGEQIGQIAWIGHQREGIAVDDRQALDADVRVDVEQRQRRADDVALGAMHRCGPRLDLDARDRRMPHACPGRLSASPSCRRSSAGRRDRPARARRAAAGVRRAPAAAAPNHDRRPPARSDRRPASRARS